MAPKHFWTCDCTMTDKSSVKQGATVERVCWGERDNMIAEYAAADPRKAGVAANECRFLVMPVGNGNWDPDWFPTERKAQAHAKYIADEESAYQERRVPVSRV